MFILGIGMVCVVIFVQDGNKIKSGCAHAVVLCCQLSLLVRGEAKRNVVVLYISVVLSSTVRGVSTQIIYV